ncbi:GNAT family N-acetyltransferase [Bordetella genomosp. 13]|uniref:GNAT family N-acetyltransferase n=1 Tax=Bordetella genomosp. 13 TaxID=463040 RepID=UPI0011A298C6|nr:GNAT family N-acetyltransferase [Bordetella genomosp. 13]
MPTWTCKPHADLTTTELYALLRLRSEVFVVEQQCVFLDLDGQDLAGDTWHLMGWENGALVAGARLLDPAGHDGDAVIGRVVTAAAARGRGLGHELMRQALQAVRRLWPEAPIYLGAQHRLQAFYAGHGFVSATDVYMEDGIAHVGMRKA